MTLKSHQTSSVPDNHHWCLSIALGLRFFTWPAHKYPVQGGPWTLLQTHLMSFLPHLLLPCSPINLCAGPWICFSSFILGGLPMCHSLFLECSSFYLLPGPLLTFELSLISVQRGFPCTLSFLKNSATVLHSLKNLSQLGIILLIFLFIFFFTSFPY